LNQKKLDEVTIDANVTQMNFVEDDIIDEEEFYDMTDTSSVATCESIPDMNQTPPTTKRMSQKMKKENDESSKNVIKTQFDYLFFHATSPTNSETQTMVKCGVYSEYNKETNMTLLLICDATAIGNMEPTQEEVQEEENEQDSDTIKKQLAQAAKRINIKLSSFVSFLQVKAQAHITMLHYLHYCPGMIHFIFVDRVRNRVIAPRIVSLHTSNSAQDTDHGGDEHLQPLDASTAFIKSKVWEMCYVSQQYRDEGYTEVGVCGNGVQYWFKEWLEDENGIELRWTKPNLKHARTHYELYTMYLPFVSTQAIAHHNKTLVSLLLDRPHTK
jgi:predicted DNA binding CopG/RHH family protein